MRTLDAAGGAARVLLVGGAALVLGAGLAALGALVGPAAMVVLPVGAGLLLLTVARPETALVLVLASLPIGLQDVPGNPVGLQVVQLVALGAAGAALLGRLAQGRSPVVVPPQMLWAVALVLWALAATPGSPDLGLALRVDANLVGAVLVSLVAVSVVTDLSRLRRTAQVLLLASTAVNVPALAGASDIQAAYGGAVVAGRLEGSFTQPNELGCFAMISFVVGIGLVLGARSGRERAFALVCTAPALAALCLSLSRGAWIGTVFAGLVLLVLLPSARRSVVTVGLPLLLLGVAIGSFAPESTQVQVVGDRVATLTESGGGNPYDDRPRIWAEGRREVRDSPVLGQGPGQFPVVSTRSASGAQTVQAQHAHSVLLTTAAELGLVGASLLIGLTVAAGLLTVRAVRRLDPSDGAVLAGVGAACVAIAAQGIIDFTMRNAVLLVLVWLVLGLLVAGGRAALALPPAVRDEPGLRQPTGPPRAAAGAR